MRVEVSGCYKSGGKVQMINLGKLEMGDLRGVWKNESSDFTTWLSKDENLALLSDEIGIDIKLVKTEASVGTFNLDILAEEETSERKIIIENQLEKTDHDHLGKIITYASGYDASIIIWIVKDVRDEHKQAIDWLNDHTDEDINFFIVRMELWKIGDSPYAPKFHIVSEPNDWAKAIKKSAAELELTDTELLQFDYWTKFKEYASKRNTHLKLRKTYPQHWYDISIGSAECHMRLTVNTREDLIGCEIWIHESKELFHELFSHKNDIESELGGNLDWMELPDRKASRIKISRRANISEVHNWENWFDWMLNQAEEFHKLFGKYIKTSSI